MSQGLAQPGQAWGCPPLSPDQKSSRRGEGRQQHRETESDELRRGHSWGHQTHQGHEPHPWPVSPMCSPAPAQFCPLPGVFNPVIIIPNLQINPAICARSHSDPQSAREGPRPQWKELCVPSEGTGLCPSIPFPEGWAQRCLLLQFHPKFTAGNSAAAALPMHPLLRHGGDTRDQPAPTQQHPQTTPSPAKLPPTAFPNGADPSSGRILHPQPHRAGG